MKSLFSVLAFTLLFSCSSAPKSDQPVAASASPSPMPVVTQPPMAEEIPHRLEKHGDVRNDPWFWLKNRTDEKVLSYLRAENAYLDHVMKPTAALQEKLFEEMKGRIKQDDSTYPAPNGPYSYYVRYETGKEYPIHCRRLNQAGAAEEILLNVNDLAKGHSFYQARVFVSPDHKRLAYAADTVGRRIFTIHFKDLATGKNLPDQITATAGQLAWANDGQTIFYVRQHPETLRWEKVFRHQLGQAEDPLIYEEKDETFNVHVSRGDAEKYLFIHSESTLTSEVRYLNADQPQGVFQVFHPREKKHEYTVIDAGDRFLIHTNFQAKNFRLMQAPYDRPGKWNWKEFIPHRPDTLLEEVIAFKSHLALQERRKGLTQLQLVDRKTGKGSYLQFKDPVYLASLGENLEFEAGFLRFEYESMTTPPSVYDFNFTTGEQVLRKQKEVLGGFDSSRYESMRLFARAKDGVQVPISLVFRKDTQRGKDTPLLVYGYGSYGSSMDPYFNSNIVSLLDRGFVYAIVHVRGGSEMGRAWYEDGRQMKKKNTFTDFISSTEFLHQTGLSSPAHTYAMGGSAGGLLMGAVMNLRPDLYRGIVAQVPFVDVITTMLDETIPLTTGEYDEWGNPNDPKAYRYIRSYSPYDNVTAKAYPNLLVTTGLHDSQVQYWEPAKWVAKLRKLKTNDSLVLMKTEMEAGHGGKSGRFERLRLWALQYAFLLHLEQKK